MRTSDLRLAAPAAGCWAAAATALAAPVAVSVSISAGFGAAGIATAVWSRRNAGLRRAIGVSAAAACGLIAASALAVVLRVIAVDSAPIRTAEGKPTVEVETTGDPVFLTGGRMRVPVTVRALSGLRQRPVAAQLTAPVDGPDVLPGERYRVRVRVRPPRDRAADRLQAAQLTATGPMTGLRGPPWWQRAAGTVRERLRDVSLRALPERSAGLLPGLVLGDVSGLDERTAADFRAAGLAHLIAVSGSNFALVCGAVILGVRSCGASERTVAILGGLAIIGFVILVRPTDSVLRAAVMGSVGLAAGLGSRRAQALPALGTAVIVVTLLWPQMALAPGFALSVVATLGLVLWSVPIRSALVRRGVPEAPATLLSMTLAAQVLTTPLLIAVTDTVNLLSVPANLLAVPVVGIAGLLGTAAAVIGGLGPRYGPTTVLAELLVRAAGPPTRWLIAVADWLGGPRWSTLTVPGPTAVTVLVLGAAGVLGWRSRGRVRGVWHHVRCERSAVLATRRRRLPDRARHLEGLGRAQSRGGGRRTGHPRPRR
ncbi:ComEC/Rec2 family competence protein [Gordonia sp. LUNF6]|uniref:ComEC/Rec2 family competence protein n=1 Tax=Gordonia TaxID=2053 RepID=UPI002417EA05|nr:ComEC/Rec2 family competence protein [Gordonia sihwensis]WFN91723.1 ComEC/Rec2 family competence protein [Gordonia sihwensis]